MKLTDAMEGVGEGNYRVIGRDISHGDYFVVLESTKYELIARLVQIVNNVTSKVFKLRRKTAGSMYYTINRVGFFVGDEEE